MNFPRLTVWLLSSLCLLAGTSCKKNSEPAPPEADSIAVRYAQTQCADKWGQATTTQQLEAVATTYLVQQGIAFTQAHATQAAPAAVCNACTCTTGVVLEGRVNSSQLAAIQVLGFTKI